MQFVTYAATRCGYRVQVIDGGEIVYQYLAGNCGKESQTFIDPSSPNAIGLRQLRRWAKKTAAEVAEEQGIPMKRVEYDDDLEAELNEQDSFALA